MSMNTPRKRALEISAIVVLVACATLGAVRTTAGIQGSGLREFAAIGPITALGSGSVDVGGTQYSTSGAQLQIDGSPGSQSQLSVGDVVSISGSSAPGGHKDTAAAVSFSSNVRGEVSSIDLSAATFFVLGQTVHVTSATLFASSIQPSGLEGVQSGETVEVSGFADASGNIVATRVGTTGDSAVARVVGAVRNLNPQQGTFNINSLVVSYGGAAVGGTLSDGVSVAVQGPPPVANGALTASRVDVTGTLQAPAGSEGRIQGLITDFPSADYFEVDGIPVAVESQTHLQLQVPLGLDVAVEVTGVFDATGTLVARNIHSKTKQD
jgi:hypothetical protein